MLQESKNELVRGGGGRMAGRHARSRIPRVLGRLRTGFNQAGQDRDLSDRLAAVTRHLQQRDLSIAAIYEEGRAAGLAERPAPGVRRLTSVPTARGDGTAGSLTGRKSVTRAR